jgi:hypothetical protein
MKDANQRVVVCAAIRNKKGQVACGARHYDSVMRQAMDRFEKDCFPKGDDEYYCWHKVPYGPGPYCTGCGGLIKPSNEKVN